MLRARIDLCIQHIIGIPAEIISGVEKYVSCIQVVVTTLCLAEISYWAGPLNDEFKEILWGYDKIIRRLADERGVKIGYVLVSLYAVSVLPHPQHVLQSSKRMLVSLGFLT